MMSRTFSMKKGSVERLKCRWRCGCRSKARQMRCTVDLLNRVSSAIERTVQCVAARGLVLNVRRISCATRSSEIERGRPGRNSSWRPCRPSWRSRWRQEPTVGIDKRNRRAISVLLTPSAARMTIWARWTRPCGRDRDEARAFNCWRSSRGNLLDSIYWNSFYYLRNALVGTRQSRDRFPLEDCQTNSLRTYNSI